DGPARASVVDHTTVPYLCDRCAPSREHARLELSEKALLLVSRLGTREALAAWAFGGEHGKKPVPSREEGVEDMTLITTDAIDLRRAIPSFPWESDAIQAWVILHDSASNPVKTKIAKQEIGDHEVEKFLDGLRKPAYAEPVSP